MHARSSVLPAYLGMNEGRYMYEGSEEKTSEEEEGRGWEGNVRPGGQERQVVLVVVQIGDSTPAIHPIHTLNSHSVIQHKAGRSQVGRELKAGESIGSVDYR